jgi:predicted AAA+ superfamily ATPase
VNSHSDQAGLVPRHAVAGVREDLADFRVVVLNGPRQCGKTTLARGVTDALGGVFLSLDDPLVLAAVRDDPRGVLNAPGLVVVDEFQRGGNDLLLAVKQLVDTDPIPGRFLLTGSSRFLTVPTLSESLTGRAVITVMWPYSQGEQERRVEGFIDLLTSGPERLRQCRPDPLEREEYLRRICLGGFPEVQNLSERARGRWFDSYVQTVTQRDVLDLSRIRQAAELPYLVRLLAARTGQELVVQSLAQDSGVPRQSLESYLPLLETVYLLYRLPAWTRNPTGRLIRRPKIYPADTGLSAHLLSATPRTLAARTSGSVGPLMEQFVVLELEKQRSWARSTVELFHYRERAGSEVDVLVEDRAGSICGIEVKASASVRSADFRGLIHLRDRLGAAFTSGVVLYTGDRVLPFGDRLTAMPVSALWAAA